MPEYEYPILGLLGGEILTVEDGYARGRLDLSPKIMQPTGVYHAGAIVTLADEVASAAICGGTIDPEHMQGRNFPYSIQLSVNLLDNCNSGPIYAEARVSRKGRITVVDTEVLSKTGKRLALMRSTHFMVDPGRQGPHLRSETNI